MNKCKRLLICLLLILSMVSAIPFYSSAHPTAAEHNDELEAVLFGDGYSKYKSTEIKKYICDIEDASYLCIDQFGENGRKYYDELKENGVSGIPLTFNKIKYDTDPLNNSKKVSATTHRLYTHQGWDRDYSVKGKAVEKFWKARRKVLLGTINSVFGFQKVTIAGYGEKCESLAGIIYYVHILGDYNEADKYSKITLLAKLENDDANDEDKDYGVITSLKSYIEILFEDQEDTFEYEELMDGLDKIGESAGKLEQSYGGVNTDSEFEEYHQYADDIMDLLKEYMPDLLRNEEWFSAVFYSD